MPDLKNNVKNIVVNSNILSAIRRRYRYIKCAIEQGRYEKDYRNTDNSKKLLEYKDKYKGKRCFIIGNGPSLTATDLDKLINEYTFAANRIWLMYDKTAWRPSFYACQDRQMIRGEYERIKKYVGPVFLGFNAIDEFDLKFDNAIAYFLDKKSQLRRPCEMPFSLECDKYIIDGTTVTYSSIQLAVYMGFTEIYLLGVDNSFKYTMDKNRKITEDTSVKQTYFDPRYKDVYDQFGQAKGKKAFGVTDPEMNDKIYTASRRASEKLGIKIMNATRGGKLENFERIDFDSLF